MRRLAGTPSGTQLHELHAHARRDRGAPCAEVPCEMELVLGGGAAPKAAKHLSGERVVTTGAPA